MGMVHDLDDLHRADRDLDQALAMLQRSHSTVEHGICPIAFQGVDPEVLASCKGNGQIEKLLLLKVPDPWPPRRQAKRGWVKVESRWCGRLRLWGAGGLRVRVMFWLRLLRGVRTSASGRRRGC